MIEIRQMQLIDIPVVANIEQLVNPSPWTEQQFQDELGNPCSRVDLLMVDNAIAAYLCSWLIVDELQVQNVATAPGFRRQGYAEMLIQHVLQGAAQKGVNRVFLEVRVGNSAARKLYEKLRFVNCGIRKKYYADNEDAQLMELNLVI